MNFPFTFSFYFAGLHIIYTQDEVDVIQNLMFYIETAYKVAVRTHKYNFKCFIILVELLI